MGGSELFKSFDGLLREKGRLAMKRQELAKIERMLVENLSRALSGIGYRVVPASGKAPRIPTTRLPARKRLRCPRCERRFSHPLPMARHLAATHGPRKTSRKPKMTTK